MRQPDMISVVTVVHRELTHLLPQEGKVASDYTLAHASKDKNTHLWKMDRNANRAKMLQSGSDFLLQQFFPFLFKKKKV